MDKTEFSNINYKEYLHFKKTRYTNQYFYTNALPDTLVWMGLDTCLRDLGSTYLRSQDFDDYPVVGVSIIQAENYSRWRRDRVLEMLLGI